MNDHKTDGEPSWMSDLRGKAREAFQRAVAGQTQAKPAVTTIPNQPQKLAPRSGLHDGPKPPWVIGWKVTRQSFNRRWREEGPGFRSMRWKLREEFNRKAGTIRNTVVQSESKGTARPVKSDFNRAAQVRRRRSR